MTGQATDQTPPRKTTVTSDSLFRHAKRVRSFEDIAAQIKDGILSGRLRNGERLPSERELCQAFGVSRATLREGLRVLEAGGVVKIRPGAHGGVFVSEPDEDQIGSAIEAVLQFRKATARDLAEFRATFEAETASWAAQRAEEEDDAMLEQIVADFRRGVAEEAEWSTLAELDLRFHEAVARASKNQVRVAIMLGIHRAVYNASVSLDDVATARVRHSIVKELESVRAAIRARDVRTASRRMKNHVQKFSELELLVHEGREPAAS